MIRIKKNNINRISIGVETINDKFLRFLNRKHTKEEFQHIDKLNKKYVKLLEQTNDSNGEFEVEYQYFKDLYAQRIRKNDFLENREGITND